MRNRSFTDDQPRPVYGRLPIDGPRELAATLDQLAEAAFFGLPLIDLSPMRADPTRPSSVRVFGKSLHMLTLGWALAVLWLWAAGLQQSVLRDGGVPPDYGLRTLALGALSAGVMESLALWITNRIGRAPSRLLERREWHHAFWWSFFPNLMLWATVYLMIVASY
jgi:hypothetical protein